MASQEFGMGHFTGIAVIGLILLSIAVLIITFMQFGNTTAISQTGNPLNMQNSDGSNDHNLINTGNVMFIHDPNADGTTSDVTLTLRPNFKGRRGKQQDIKNNTGDSVINLEPIDGLNFDGGLIEDALVVKPGVYAVFVYRLNNTLLRLQ
uniref:Uncharacterized protein n=1 Tax=Pithovirus LCPAC404 TaxID=2506597 RepID=A0A481ZBX5_9VIRU|nr:MAG: hypothetical protein LCPAC404_01180 [Pithovirus LCPAC404]